MGLIGPLVRGGVVIVWGLVGRERDLNFVSVLVVSRWRVCGSGDVGLGVY